MLEQTIIWRRLDLPGHDSCALTALDNGWRLRGTAIFSSEDLPCHLSYEVECDISWRTRSAGVTGWIGRDPVQIAIVAFPGERWQLNGIEQPDVAGCIDVDLNFTPATNLIQIRRLALKIGEESPAPAAWLSFPELAIERLVQQYHRVDRTSYAYQAPTAGYADTLDVMENGFVTRYPGLWEMISCA